MSNGQLPPVTGGAIPAAEVAQFLRTSGMTVEQLMLALIPQVYLSGSDLIATNKLLTNQTRKYLRLGSAVWL